MPHAYEIHINIFVQNPNVLVGFTVNEVLQNIIIRSTVTCSHIIVPSAVPGSIIKPIIILTLSHARVKCVKKRMMCKTPIMYFFCIKHVTVSGSSVRCKTPIMYNHFCILCEGVV